MSKRGSRPALASAFGAFVRSESVGGAILIAIVAIAMLLANSPFAMVVHDILAHPIWLEHHGRVMSLLEWINNGLMSVFFLGVGIEIRRELVSGELSSSASRRLPVIAAIGGMIVPAAIYLICNLGSDAVRGWAIPSATDIAFSLGILSLLRRRVPRSVWVFVAALAIIDDLGAVIVIALFYSTGLSLPYLIAAVLLVGLLFMLNRRSKSNLPASLASGILLWYCLLQAGIHPTIAGAATGLLISPSLSLIRFEHALTSIVAFLIIPLFALANAGVSIDPTAINALVSDPVSVGIVLGLVLGKPVGITGAVLIVRRIERREEPALKYLIGAAMLCGIGFTMSLFITQLSFADARLLEGAKLAILTASLISGIAGFSYLRVASAKAA